MPTNQQECYIQPEDPNTSIPTINPRRVFLGRLAKGAASLAVSTGVAYESSTTDKIPTPDDFEEFPPLPLENITLLPVACPHQAGTYTGEQLASILTKILTYKKAILEYFPEEYVKGTFDTSYPLYERSLYWIYLFAEIESVIKSHQGIEVAVLDPAFDTKFLSELTPLFCTKSVVITGIATLMASLAFVNDLDRRKFLSGIGQTGTSMAIASVLSLFTGSEFQTEAIKKQLRRTLVAKRILQLDSQSEKGDNWVIVYPREHLKEILFSLSEGQQKDTLNRAARYEAMIKLLPSADELLNSRKYTFRNRNWVKSTF